MPGRPHAVVDSAADLVPFGHLGWAYRSRAEFDEQAATYLRDGLSHGQHVVYVGSGDQAVVGARLRALPGLTDDEVAAVATSTVREFYDMPADAQLIDADAAVQTRVTATEAAVAAGYSGFRAVVDTTEIISTAEQRAAFARFEFMIDQKMAVLPVSALCAVDRRVLGDAAAELACLHPYTNHEAAPFRIFSQYGADTAVAGRIERADLPLLATTLDRLGGAVTGLDLEAVETMTGRGFHLLTRGLTARESSGAPTLTSEHLENAELLELRRLLGQREEQLAGLPAIEQAKGMLRHLLGLNDQQAFDALRAVSQHSNVKLRVVAVEVRDALLALTSEATRRGVDEALAAVEARLRDTGGHLPHAARGERKDPLR